MGYMNFRDMNLVASYERKMMTRNFVFILLAFLLVGGISGFHVFAYSYWRVDSYAFGRISLPPSLTRTLTCFACFRLFSPFL